MGYIYIYGPFPGSTMGGNYQVMGKGVSPVGTSLSSTLRKPEFVLAGSVEDREPMVMLSHIPPFLQCTYITQPRPPPPPHPYHFSINFDNTPSTTKTEAAPSSCMSTSKPRRLQCEQSLPWRLEFLSFQTSHTDMFHPTSLTLHNTAPKNYLYLKTYY